MSLSQFFRHLLAHLTAAALLLFVLLLLGEFFVPGSVLPFMNVIDLSWGVLGLVILSIIFSPHHLPSDIS